MALMPLQSATAESAGIAAELALGRVSPQADEAMDQVGQIVRGATLCRSRAAGTGLVANALLQFFHQLGRIHQSQHLARWRPVALNQHFGCA